MSERPVIIHSLDQGRIVAATASELKVPVVLATAPGAAAYLGPLWLEGVARRLADEYSAAEITTLLDCGDGAGHVLAALRAGCRRVRFTGRRKTADKLMDIAQQRGAEVITGNLRALDLGQETDPETACRQWLARRSEGPTGKTRKATRAGS